MQPDFEQRYHRVESSHWWFVGRRDLLSTLVRNALSDPASPILDIGCAGGATIRRLHEEGYTNVTGIDLSPAAIDHCRRSGLRKLHVMDAQNPAFAEASFDAILASDVLEHVDSESAAVRAWFRLLRPSGVLIVLVPAFMALWSPHDEANRHRKRYRLAELRRCLEQSGFETRRASYWNFLLFLPAAAVRLAQRLVSRRAGAGAVELHLPPAPVNGLLAAILLGENRLFRAGLAWPWGLSALVIARRPAAASSPGPHS